MILPPIRTNSLYQMGFNFMIVICNTLNFNFYYQSVYISNSFLISKHHNPKYVKTNFPFLVRPWIVIPINHQWINQLQLHKFYNIETLLHIMIGVQLDRFEWTLDWFGLVRCLMFFKNKTKLISFVRNRIL
jgi:hypothetical protein